MVDELIAFFHARLDEDERWALAASPGPWSENAESTEVLAVDGITVADGFALSGNQLRATVAHIARHDPDRVLREVEAKRRILDEHASEDGDCSACGRASWEENPGAYLRDEPEMADVWRPTIWPCRTARLLALPYADHPDYREKWKP